MRRHGGTTAWHDKHSPPPPQRTKPAPKIARCGVGDGSPRPHPPRPQPVGSGPRPHAPRTGGQPMMPHTQMRGAPPPGSHMAPPQRAKSASKGARCGVGDGSPHLHPPRPQPVGSGPRPQAPRTGGRAWEIAQLRTPHTQAGGAPPGLPRAAPTARKASSQEQALWGW